MGSRGTDVPGLLLLELLSLLSTLSSELIDRFENNDRKLSIRFCMAQVLRSPDRDGRQTVIRARYASLNMKYSPAVDTTINFVNIMDLYRLIQVLYNPHLLLLEIQLDTANQSCRVDER